MRIERGNKKETGVQVILHSGMTYAPSLLSIRVNWLFFLAAALA